MQRLDREAILIARTPLASDFPRLLAPVAYEIARVEGLREEIFGPVLHVVRWDGEPQSPKVASWVR